MAEYCNTEVAEIIMPQTERADSGKAGKLELAQMDKYNNTLKISRTLS